MTSEKTKQMLADLPHLPGVYKYFNKAGELIYVGKAKDLRKRVASYFTRDYDSRKTQNLVESINRLEFTIVNTERDALLLENSLIKHFQPRYNINLKDDKSYPFVVIKNEPFPRVFLARNWIKDGSEYFGPFTNVGKIKEMLELIRSLVPLRKNHTELFIRITENGKLKVSPEYYMKDGEQEEKILTMAEYNIGLQQVRNIFNGKFASVTRLLRKQLRENIEEMEFEKAERLQQKLEFIKEYRASSEIIDTKMGDLDVFTLRIEETQAFVNFLQVRKSAILQTNTFTFKPKLNTSKEEILVSAILYLQKRVKSLGKELIVPFVIEHPNLKSRITIPKRGIKRKLLKLSLKNLNYFCDNSKHYSVTEIMTKD
ncbi:GIY-YIG nuclease family protein [Aequorivita marina]|uniref:GIY-YIG nuclease family protein n=1 Tax=Aequorivita marina TaxID=3073654 RepID=UPI0028746E3F|nr:GIY-YIG nuclease family protein [Aequorivita sp. S2608]MDS1299171.1 GIY-YIG nuclease family protein [Aequorivita sp. S2608]